MNMKKNIIFMFSFQRSYFVAININLVSGHSLITRVYHCLTELIQPSIIGLKHIKDTVVFFK